MALVEDRAAFFVDFGVVATIGGNPVTVIFDNEFLASLDVESSNPVALANSDDLAGVSHGTTVVIDSVSYTVAGLQPDGTGFTVIELEAV